MKTLSISASIVLFALLGIMVSTPDLGTLVSSASKSSNVRTSHKLTGSNLKPLTYFGDSYLGNGYHSYGNFSIDVSGLPANSDFTLSWGSYIIPNRFTLSNGTHTESSNWVGSASYPCGWGSGSISTSNTGLLSINIGSATTLTLTVEGCNDNPATNYDQWDVSY